MPLNKFDNVTGYCVSRNHGFTKYFVLTCSLAEMASRTINLVVIGDGAVGKTCLIESYVEHPFPTTYVPTVFQKYTGSLMINGEDVGLKIWDTAG